MPMFHFTHTKIRTLAQMSKTHKVEKDGIVAIRHHRSTVPRSSLHVVFDSALWATSLAPRKQPCRSPRRHSNQSLRSIAAALNQQPLLSSIDACGSLPLPKVSALDNAKDAKTECSSKKRHPGTLRHTVLRGLLLPLIFSYLGKCIHVSLNRCARSPRPRDRVKCGSAG